jgi:hypothetical protein
MDKNVCGAEKWIRAFLGVAILLAGLYYGSWWGLIGFIPLITAVISYCPVTHAIGFSSCRMTPSVR